MTKEQLSCEKTVLQKNLLHYEGLHGRPVSHRHPESFLDLICSVKQFLMSSSISQVTREERLVVKPLYDRYRLVKQMLTRVSITPVTVRTHKHSNTQTQRRTAVIINLPLLLPQVSPSSKRRSQTLQPIIEGETAHFWEEIKEEEEDERKDKEGGEEEEREEEREEEEEEEEEEEAESSGGEMQSSEVIMAVDVMTPTDGPARSQNQPDRQSNCPMTAKMEEGSGRLALDLRLSSSNASSM